MREIAEVVGMNPSTISRELKRNSGLRGYRPKQAHQKAQSRHSDKAKAIALTEEIKSFIFNQLKSHDSSPEQISGRMKLLLGYTVSHETIYRYLLENKKQGGVLYLHLRHKAKKYRKRYGSTDRRGQIINRISIDSRPDIVEQKSRIGDFEGDLIIGKNHKGAFVTLVDRHSKFSLITSVATKNANGVKDKIIELLLPYTKILHTITFDNGKEFAHHEQMKQALEADIYFAHPYHSWERGLNEHTNGLIRQYYPKGTSLEGICTTQLQGVQDKLNHRPRKSLGYKTPFEVFFAKITLVS